MGIRYYDVRVGESCSPPGKGVSVSRSYKRWAHEIYPLMINAFELCGASLDISVRTLVFNFTKVSTILTKAIELIKRL